MRIFALIALAATGGCAAVPSSSGETSIPFVQSSGVLDWKPAEGDALYVQAHTGSWYLVRTIGPCSRLKTGVTLGFGSGPSGDLRRGDFLVASGQRCPVASVVRSSPPPKKAAAR